MTVKMNKTRKIQVGVSLLVPLMIMCIPVTEVFTSQMRIFTALTLWMLLWAAFELTDLLIPSLLWPVLLILLGVVPATTIYSSWLSLVIPCCVSAILMAGILQKTGLLERITFWIVAKCGGSFNRTMYALYLACLVLSVLTFAGASIIIAALCYGMCKSLNMDGKEEAAITMMVGMLGASTVRMFIYQPLTAGLVLGSVLSVDPNFTFTVFDLVKYNWPVLVYSLLVIFIMLKIANTKNSSINESKEYFWNAYLAKGKLTTEEKKGAFLLALLILGILTNPIHNIDGMAIFVMVACLAYCPGIDLGTTEEIKALPVGTIFFIASCMAIGAGCTATGLTNLIINAATPVLATLDPKVVLFGILIFGIVINLLMTPMAMVAAFSGPMVALCSGLAMDPLAPVYTFIFSTDMVFLPYEYVTFLIFFSFGMMSTWQFVKYHSVKNLLFIIFYVIAILPYWGIVGLI